MCKSIRYDLAEDGVVAFIGNYNPMMDNMQILVTCIKKKSTKGEKKP